MDLVKLVNYIRTAVRDGQGLPEMSAKVFFRDDRWLKPVLEDDSLLYSLGDMISDEDIIEENARDEAVRHQFQVLIVHDPEKAALRLEQYEAQIRATEEALLKSTQQLELTQKALERANILADQAKAALDEQSLESGAQRIVRDSKAETLDDPYLGICESILPECHHVPNQLSHTPPNASRQSAYGSLPRFHSRQQASLRRQGRA